MLPLAGIELTINFSIDTSNVNESVVNMRNNRCSGKGTPFVDLDQKKIEHDMGNS